MFTSLFDFRETDSFRTYQEADGTKKSFFEKSGYEQANYILLISPLIVILLAYLVYQVLKCLLVCATRRCSENFFTRCLRKKLSIKGFALRFLFESCLEIGICAMISIIMVSSGESRSNFQF